MAEENLENEQVGDDTSGVKWAWIVIFIVTCFATVMIERETFTYALGHSCATLVAGFIASPILYLILKKFLKIKWMWYHWFNIATSVGFGLDILRWIIVPMARNIQ